MKTSTTGEAQSAPYLPLDGCWPASARSPTPPRSRSRQGDTSYSHDVQRKERTLDVADFAALACGRAVVFASVAPPPPTPAHEQSNRQSAVTASSQTRRDCDEAQPERSDLPAPSRSNAVS